MLLQMLDINFLMTVAVGGALALQDVTEATSVVVLFSLADWLESACCASAKNAIAGVLALKPDMARLAETGTACLPSPLCLYCMPCMPNRSMFTPELQHNAQVAHQANRHRLKLANFCRVRGTLPWVSMHVI